MKIAIVELVGESPLSFSKYYKVPELEGESKADYEERTWRERLHVDEKDNVLVPPMAFKNCLSNAARYLGEKIEGAGQKKWTKRFEAGIMITEPSLLYGLDGKPIKKGEVEGEYVFVPSDGKKGGSKRVVKCFPKIENWKCTVKFIIVDDSIITNQGGKIFERHLSTAGKFVGIGRFRPQMDGYYGRFKAESINVVEE